MTASDLIAELQRYPGHLPVKILLSEVIGGNDDSGNFNDELVQVLTPADAIEADRVIFEGTYLLIESK